MSESLSSQDLKETSEVNILQPDHRWVGLFCSTVFLLLCTTACSRSVQIALTNDGISTYRIVLSEKSTESDQHAALVLQNYISAISGAALPVVEAGEETGEDRILIGSTTSSDHIPDDIDREILEEDGFTIRIAGSDIIILGGSQKGSLYGVYTLLESHMGCRFYGPGAQVIPRRPSISLPTIEDTQVPVIHFRSTHYAHAYEPDFEEWHKLDDGNKVRYRDWSTRVHTFQRLVPPGDNFEEHPEYFSEINGIRVPDTQLCLTNPDVFKIVVARLREMMEESPDVKYWSVSQNDTYGNCQCPECRALDERAGGPMGSLLTFVNRVAAEFPDKIISTLAYQYSRAAPLNIRPAENVCITLCSIECNRSAPISTDPRNAAFRKDVEEWGKIAGRIQVWDYVVQFRNLVSPFPNLHVLQPNIRFFVDNGIDALFEQGSGGLRGEFTDLRSHIIAKLLWNPETDIEDIINDFLEGYYGEAAPHLRRYINLMHRALRRSGERLDIYGNPYTPVEGYLSPRLMQRYERFLERAEEAVADHPVFHERVTIARLPLAYARLEQAKRYGTGELGFFTRRENGNWEVRPAMRRRLNDFVEMCKNAGIELLEEHGTSPDEYRTTLEHLFSVSMENHLALFKPVEVLSTTSPKYPANGPATFTDGLKGIADWTCNWLGFEGHDMDVVIDLEDEKRVSSISTDFLQAYYAWVWLPREVKYSVSSDGVTFNEVALIPNRTPDNKPEAFIETFSAEFEPVRTRYIRVTAIGIKTCPEWHQGHPGDAWIFADEIIVR